MKLRPFFSYYGGKWLLAPKYPVPVYDTIIEPFAGSAGYSLHYAHKKVILYEINPVIAGLWDYLIKVDEREIMSLPLQITDLREMNLTQEQKWLIGLNISKANTMNRHRPSAWMRDSQTKTGFWSGYLASKIVSQLKHIRHWIVKNESYENAPDIPATWFVDPPYNSTAGRCYKYHDLNFLALGEWCQSRKGQVIVCEGPDAKWLPFRKFVDARVSNGKHKGRKGFREVVWTKCDKKVGFF